MGTFPFLPSPREQGEPSCLRTYPLLLFALQGTQLRSRGEDLNTGTAPTSRAEQLQAGSRAQPWRRECCTWDCQLLCALFAFLLPLRSWKPPRAGLFWEHFIFVVADLMKAKTPPGSIFPSVWSTDLQHGQAVAQSAGFFLSTVQILTVLKYH